MLRQKDATFRAAQYSVARRLIQCERCRAGVAWKTLIDRLTDVVVTCGINCPQLTAESVVSIHKIMA